MGEIRGANRVLVWKHEGMRLHRGFRHRFQGNIKWIFKE